VEFNEHNMVAPKPRMVVEKPKYYNNKPSKAGHQTGSKTKNPQDAKGQKTKDPKVQNTDPGRNLNLKIEKGEENMKHLATARAR